IPGKNGKLKGGDAPTLGILGRLGGIGARPEVIGFVSDGDGALPFAETEDAEVVVVCAQIEAEISELDSAEEKKEFLETLGLEQSG
ncbi:DUF1177 family protein, partial [Clostridioides difficile]